MLRIALKMPKICTSFLQRPKWKIHLARKLRSRQSPQDVAPAPARRSAYPGRRASWRRWRCRRRCSPDRCIPPRRPPGRSWWRDFRARRRRRSQRPPPAGRHGSRWSPAVGCRATRGTSSRRCCRRPSRSSGSCRRWGDALKQASTATCTNTLTLLQGTSHDTRNHDAIRIAIHESRCNTYRDTSLMLRLIDYQPKIEEA